MHYIVNANNCQFNTITRESTSYKRTMQQECVVCTETTLGAEYVKMLSCTNLR